MSIHDIFKIVLVSLWVIEMLAKISMIGEKCEPHTAGQITVLTALNGALLWGIIAWL